MTATRITERDGCQIIRFSKRRRRAPVHAASRRAAENGADSLDMFTCLGGHTFKIDAGPAPAALLQKLMATTHLFVGDVAEFVRGMPEQWVVPTAAQVLGCVQSDIAAQRRNYMSRRNLVFGTMLLSRILQDIEAVPTDPDEEI